MSHKLTVAYFDDCPHYEKAAASARVAVARYPVEVEVTHRDDLPEDQREKFQGSPTLYLDGEPLIQSAQSDPDSCRTFTDEHGREVKFPNAGMIENRLDSELADEMEPST